MMVRARYQPKTDTTYMHHYSGNMELYQERCHVLLGRKHNACYPRYGQWGNTVDEACPEWFDEHVADRRRFEEKFER